MARDLTFTARTAERFARSACVFILASASVCTALATPALALRDVADHDIDALRDGLDEAEGDALTTLALADESLRDAILDASVNSDALASLSAIQERSSRAFRERLDREERATQKDAWELSRYPELVDELVAAGRPTRGAVDRIVAPYPERIREIASGLALHHFSLVNDIATIREDAERENQRALSSLPLSTQASFEALIERPDLLSAMLREPEVANRLAEMVQEDAWNARSVLDREHARLSAQREQELEDWRETIENDPEAERELRESAQQFAENEGYDDLDEYAEGYADGRADSRREVHHIYHHPYPWWFGPPHWQVGWHWYPHHTHWGFHVAIGGGLSIYSLPSPVFSYWYYRRPVSHGHHHSSLQRHWSGYGTRHHLHRDYKHRAHYTKRHRYHHREQGVHRGHRAKRYEGHDRGSKSRSRYDDRRRYDSTNKFFRHDTVEQRMRRDEPLHRVARDEPRSRDQRKERYGRTTERRRVSKRDDRGAPRGDRMHAREPSRNDRERKSTRIARNDSRDDKRNRLTTSDRRSSSKQRAAPTRSNSRSKFGNTMRSKTKSASSQSRSTNKFMRSSERGSGSKKSARVGSKTSSKRSKDSNRSSKSNKSRKAEKSSKKKGGGASNKFFARR